MTKTPDRARRDLSFPAAASEETSESSVRRKVDLSATVTLSGDALAALLEQVKRVQNANGEAPLPALSADEEPALEPVLEPAPVRASPFSRWRGRF